MNHSWRFSERRVTLSPPADTQAVQPECQVACLFDELARGDPPPLPLLLVQEGVRLVVLLRRVREKLVEVPNLHYAPRFRGKTGKGGYGGSSPKPKLTETTGREPPTLYRVIPEPVVSEKANGAGAATSRCRTKP